MKLNAKDKTFKMSVERYFIEVCVPITKLFLMFYHMKIIFYFIIFIIFYVHFQLPPHEPITSESLLEESLALVHPKDITLHRAVFLVPFEPSMLVKTEKKRLWSRTQRKFEYNPANVLRSNIKFMIRETRHFGLLLSQLTWVGLLNLAEKRHVVRKNNTKNCT